MGCLRGLLFWRKNKIALPDDGIRTRPHHNSITSEASSNFYDDLEKPYLDRDPSPKAPLPSTRAPNVRPVNPTYSAYSTPANYRDGGRGPRYPDTDRTNNNDSSDFESYSKLKEEGIDDPEEAARRKKAEEARRKAEQEEQERLDFFQMM